MWTDAAGSGRRVGLLLAIAVIGACAHHEANPPAASEPVEDVAEDTLPAYLVGVWATEASALRGETLVEGAALYLDADGVAASVGAPPPIGVPLFATFDEATNVLDLMTLDRTPVERARANYDPGRTTIQIGSDVLHRHRDSISPRMREEIDVRERLR